MGEHINKEYEEYQKYLKEKEKKLKLLVKFDLSDNIDKVLEELNKEITEEEIKEYDVYFTEDEIDLIVRLDIKKLRNMKNTTFISTSESLEGISRWLNYGDEE